MPRKHKYPNNEESPIHDVDVDPFNDNNVSAGDIEKVVEKKLDTGNEIDRILKADPGACVCSVRHNKDCRVHRWSDRNI